MNKTDRTKNTKNTKNTKKKSYKTLIDAFRDILTAIRPYGFMWIPVDGDDALPEDKVKAKVVKSARSMALDALYYVAERFGITLLQGAYLTYVMRFGHEDQGVPPSDINSLCAQVEAACKGNMTYEDGAFEGSYSLDNMLAFSIQKELSEMAAKGVLYESYEGGTACYYLSAAAGDAISNNSAFVKATYSKKQERALFFTIMDDSFEKGLGINELNGRFYALCKQHPDVPFLKSLERYGLEDEDVLILACACCRYYIHGLRLYAYNVEPIVGSGKMGAIMESFMDGSNPLVKNGLLKKETRDDETEFRFGLTQKGKDEFIGSFESETASETEAAKEEGNDDMDPNLIHYGSLAQKQLFYNKAEREQMDLLTEALGIERFAFIQNGLNKMRHKKGMACLFYGAPGTGKTESVYQLALQTKRDIIAVNCANIRGGLVGDGERNIKTVFDDYRKSCKGKDALPILLFNEADSLFCKRFESVQESNELYENAMQSVILQELDRFDGILIATTNLSGAMDGAFERRFLYKIEFNRPSAETRARIWMSMLPNLTDDQASMLAEDYDLSGAQIENAVSKYAIKSLMKGISVDKVDLASLEKECGEEGVKLHNTLSKRVKVGFAA
jgi:hypothetical protein